MSGVKLSRTVGVVVTVYVSFVVAKYFWAKSKLDKKLRRKRNACQKTLKQLEQVLKKEKLSTGERDAILSLPLAVLQSKLQSGELKAVDVLHAYQDKALEVNISLNCVVEAVVEAQELAAECDALDDKSRLLHGIPLSLKENIGLQGYDTTGGLQINIGQPLKEDSVVVQVFKLHGAIPFVRTNVPQAMLSFTCINPMFGETVNPHDVQRSPGGSSGGEGSIIGAGASLMGLGTDVGGSVRVPATFCGLCALKTTMGRFSKLGVYTVYKGQTLISGVVGPMARDVHSLVVMTRVLASPPMFKLDPTLPPLPFQEQLFSSKEPLRIGYYYSDGCLPPVPAVRRAVEEAKRLLEGRGHTLVEFKVTESPKTFYKMMNGTLVGGDEGETLRKALRNDYTTKALRISKIFSVVPRWLLALLIKIFSVKEPVTGGFLAAMLSDGRTYSWFCHVTQLQEYRSKFMNRWKSAGLDAVICPAFPSPAPKLEDTGYLTPAISYCGMYNVLNFPAGVVPVTKVNARDVADVNNPSLYPAKGILEKLLKNSCSKSDSMGLPVAVQCATLPFTEELCLRVMAELEAAVAKK